MAEKLLEHGADARICYRGRTPEVHHREKGKTAVAAAIRGWKGEPKPAAAAPAPEPAKPPAKLAPVKLAPVRLMPILPLSQPSFF